MDHEVPKNWEGEAGRIDRDMIKEHVKRPQDILWYLCGPPPMTDAMKVILEEMEVPKDQLRWEDWQIPGKHD